MGGSPLLTLKPDLEPGDRDQQGKTESHWQNQTTIVNSMDASGCQIQVSNSQEFHTNHESILVYVSPNG